MKLLFAVLVIVCIAGAVRGQAAGVDCGPSNACDANLVCQDSKCRIKLEANCDSKDKCVLMAEKCDTTCKCITGATPNSQKTMCDCTDSTKVIKEDGSVCLSKVDETCSKADDCIANADCTGSPMKCVCKADYKASDDKTKCSGAATAVISLLLMLAAFVVTRWV